MTEGELVQSITAYYELSGNALSMYVTVSMGYLVAAYFIGYNLTKSQVIVVSTLYAVVAAVMSYAMFGYMARGFTYVEMQNALNPELVSYSSPVFYVLLPMIFGAGIIACLKFMWDVRHPKTT